MSKKFSGRVSIVENTKGEATLRKDAEGDFHAGNAAECFETLKRVASEEGLSIDKWALFQPEGGTEPVLLANRYGNPYLFLAPPGGDSNNGRKRCRKLA